MSATKGSVTIDALEYVRIGTALLYHEARYVRTLKVLPEPASWGALRALPSDPRQAWYQIRPLLARARKVATAASVQGVFEGYFHKTVADLEALFREASFPGGVGGPKWAKIAAAVQDLNAAIEANDGAQIQVVLSGVKGAEHNTGSLLDKYRRLESVH